MQLSPLAFSVNPWKVQPRYSGGIGVSGNQPSLFIDRQMNNLIPIVLLMTSTRHSIGALVDGLVKE